LDSEAIRSCANSSLRPFLTPFSKPHYVPDRPFDLTHIAIEVVPDFREQTIRGRATLTLKAQRDGLKSLRLDIADLKVKIVSLKEKGLLIFHQEDGKMTVELPSEVAVGETVELAVEYEGKPRKGLYFRKPDEFYPDRPVQLWTQGEDEDSHYWFPCIDTPAQKTTSEVIATVPSSFTAISNGRLVEVKEDAEKGTKTFHYSQDKPHSVYLITLVAGEYVELKEEVDGVPLYYYVYKGREEDAKRSFSETPSMVKFFAEKTGTPYPWDKYAQVVVNEYIFGGMENTSSTTLTDTTLHDDRAHLDFSSVPLVSHELSHMWFGDLLTCRHWKHGWLNEGFATYFEALYTEHSKGRDEFLYEMLGKQDIYLGELDRYARPIVTNVFETPTEMFDRHLYEKASVVLNMLRSLVGDVAFTRGIQTYVRDNAFGSVETSDLRKAFEKASGINLDPFFEQWLERPGHPDLQATYESKSDGMASLRVIQKQQEDAFTFRLKVKVQYEGAAELKYYEVNSKDQTLVLPLKSRPKYVSLDPDFEVLKTLEFVRPREFMVQQLKSDTVPGRIQAAKGLSKDGSLEAVEALKKALLEDPFWGVQAEAAKALGEVGNESAMRALIEGLGVQHPKARRAVVTALGQFKREEASEALMALFDKGDQSYFVEAECLRSLGKTKSAKALEFIQKGMERPSWQEVIRVAAMDGLGALEDRRALPIVMEKTKLGNHLKVREAATAAVGKLGKDNKDAFDLLTELLNDYWFRVRMAAANALVELKDTSALNFLTKAADKELDGRAKRVFREAAIKLREQKPEEQELKRLGEELDKLKEENRLLKERVDRLETAAKKKR